MKIILLIAYRLSHIGHKLCNWFHQTRVDQNFFDKPVEEERFDQSIEHVLTGINYNLMISFITKTSF